MFNHSCLPELTEGKTPTRTSLTTFSLSVPTTTQKSSAASQTGLRQQLASTCRKRRKDLVTRSLFTKRSPIRAKKAGAGAYNMTHRQPRGNSAWSLSERMMWRAPLLASEEAVFGTSQLQILGSAESTQGQFECPQFLSGSSVEKFLSLRDNLRLSPHEGNEPTARQSHQRLFRKRKWETLGLSHCFKGLLPDCSPARKRKRMNSLFYAKVVSGQASQAQTRPCRKRKWDTLVLSRYILRRVCDRSSPARKKMKMSVHNSTQKTQVWDYDSKKNFLKKRKRRTFLKLRSKSCVKGPRFQSPKRKKIGRGVYQ